MFLGFPDSRKYKPIVRAKARRLFRLVAGSLHVFLVFNECCQIVAYLTI